MSAAVAPAKVSASGKETTFKDKDKSSSVRNRSVWDRGFDEIIFSNIVAAKAVADAVRTSLGPRGMDKMIQSGNGDVTITNDGATILKEMSVIHPTAKMVCQFFYIILSMFSWLNYQKRKTLKQEMAPPQLSLWQVHFWTLLIPFSKKVLWQWLHTILLGIHPTTISDAFQSAATQAEKILGDMSTPVDLRDDALLTKMATTSLNSKVFRYIVAYSWSQVVSQHSWLLAPMAVNAVKKIIDPTKDTSVNLNMIKIVKKLGDTVEVILINML